MWWGTIVIIVTDVLLPADFLLMQIFTDAPGNYLLVSSSAIDKNSSSDVDNIGDLKAGSQVMVLEVATLLEDCKIRGRIDKSTGNPPGWITLMSTEEPPIRLAIPQPYEAPRP